MSLKILKEEEVNDYDNNSCLNQEDIREVQHLFLSHNKFVCDDPIIHTFSDGVFKWEGKDIGWVLLNDDQLNEYQKKYGIENFILKVYFIEDFYLISFK